MKTIIKIGEAMIKFQSEFNCGHGDMNQGNCLVKENGEVVLIDFESCPFLKFQNDNVDYIIKAFDMSVFFNMFCLRDYIDISNEQYNELRCVLEVINGYSYSDINKISSSEILDCSCLLQGDRRCSSCTEGFNRVLGKIKIHPKKIPTIKNLNEWMKKELDLLLKNHLDQKESIQERKKTKDSESAARESPDCYGTFSQSQLFSREKMKKSSHQPVSPKLAEKSSDFMHAGYIHFLDPRIGNPFPNGVKYVNIGIYLYRVGDPPHEIHAVIVHNPNESEELNLSNLAIGNQEILEALATLPWGEEQDSYWSYRLPEKLEEFIKSKFTVAPVPAEGALKYRTDHVLKHNIIFKFDGASSSSSPPSSSSTSHLSSISSNQSVIPAHLSSPPQRPTRQQKRQRLTTFTISSTSSVFSPSSESSSSSSSTSHSALFSRETWANPGRRVGPGYDDRTMSINPGMPSIQPGKK